jgi:hypothetical protein
MSPIWERRLAIFFQLLGGAIIVFGPVLFRAELPKIQTPQIVERTIQSLKFENVSSLVDPAAISSRVVRINENDFRSGGSAPSLQAETAQVRIEFTSTTQKREWELWRFSLGTQGPHPASDSREQGHFVRMWQTGSTYSTEFLELEPGANQFLLKSGVPKNLQYRFQVITPKKND